MEIVFLSHQLYTDDKNKQHPPIPLISVNLTFNYKIFYHLPCGYEPKLPKIDGIDYKNNTSRSFARIPSLKLAQKNQNYN